MSLSLERLLLQDWLMRSRAIATIISITITLLPIICFAKTAVRNFHAADPAYSSALAAANRFLHAWQTQDHETGIVMLTDAARQRTSPELLQIFFSPGPQAAFEIKHGKRIGPGEYGFPVALFGFSSASSRPHYCRIIVTRAGKDDWAVDKLP